MKKTFFFAVSLLLQVIFANAQSPGLSPYSFYDDFNTPTFYQGSYWFNTDPNVYAFERNGDGKLTIHATNAAPQFQSFGITFSDTLDLRGNALLKFNVENTGGTPLTINIALTDMNNKIACIEKDTGDGTWANLKRKVAVTIDPNSVKQVEIDLSEIYAVENWNCTSPATCPTVSHDFRWDKVIGAIFDFNGGAEFITSVPMFTGDVYFRNFMLGVEPCMPLTGNINGTTSVCESAKGVVYSVPLVEGATNYLWSVPAGAEIVSGQGTNEIIVDFGNNGGSISVLPSYNGCFGATRKINVALTKSLSGLIVSGSDSACGRSEKTYSVNANSSVTSYFWHVPGGASIVANNGNSIDVKFGAASGYVYVEMTNACGTAESDRLKVSVSPVNHAPVIEINGYELTSTGGANYQWYRYSEPISGANSKTYTITRSGEYKVNISKSGCPNFSNSIFKAISMLNGVNKTFVSDDFATVEPYTNVASGLPMAWWASPVYNLTRNGDGKLKVDVANGAPNWESFGLQWANVSTDSTLDLTNNANVHLVVENTADQDLDFWVQLTDINGVTVNVLKPEGDWELWKTIYAQALIPANTEKVVDIDLTGGVAIDWSCLCPVEFDWSKVKSIIFQANPGAGTVFSTQLFNGTIYLKDFMLGTYVEQQGSLLKASEARSYKWKRSGHVIDGADQRTFTPVQTGNYSVELEDIDGRKFESSGIAFVVAGVDHKQNKTYKVYPNPSEGIYNFTSEASSEVSVTDGLGRTVLNQSGSLLQLDLTALSKGFYYLKVKQGAEEYTEKLIKY
ncbi:T9SS type A sorting domain-containing protein [Sporocytophaga myxococcoides]|uniref:T9SS type A sorting domain-containing protein n=1 Tax=Sporocytophaga myxococcoides TaxID=153721 RepID=UPI00041199B9|nr:T9SS type A sorting domain-containing protein [Sporocytophaga myxococcoides]